MGITWTTVLETAWFIRGRNVDYLCVCVCVYIYIYERARAQTHTHTNKKFPGTVKERGQDIYGHPTAHGIAANDLVILMSSVA